MSDERPAHIRPQGGSIEDTDFDTASQEAAAEAILQYWPETHNFREIARRTSWSPSHIRKVFHEYFEAAEETPEVDFEENGAPGRVDAIDRDAIREAYIRGYLDRVQEELHGEEPAITPDDRR